MMCNLTGINRESDGRKANIYRWVTKDTKKINFKISTCVFRA